MILTFEDLIINIFVKIDDFHKNISPLINKQYFIENSNNGSNKKRIYKHRIDTLSESEIITILILYHLDFRKNLKKFYREYNEILKIYFPKLPSYGRFILLEKKVYDLISLFIYHLFGEETGIYYIDSTPLPVCKNQRIHRHKTFKYLAERGKSSMGWFYGFKLHLIINNKGELMNFKITKGITKKKVNFLEIKVISVKKS